MAIQAVILAGGLGTRLRPLTLERPKPVVPLLNVPFLCYQLGLLGAHGVRDVILSVSHRAEVIRATMSRERLGEVRLRDVVEKDPLGTAGGVRNAADLVDGRVVVLNGDILTDLDLSALLRSHEARGAAATIYLTPVENPTAYGLVDLEEDGRVRRFLEKPTWDEVTTNTINAGVYVLEKELLELIPKGEPHSIEREFFPLLLERGVPFYGYVSSGYWLDIGTPAKYLQAQQDLLAHRLRGHVEPAGGEGPRGWVDPTATVAASARIVGPVAIGAGCRVEADAVVGPGVVLGPGCRIGTGAHIETAVLWEEVEIGAGARLAGCLIGREASIGAYARVTAGAVLGDRTRLADYSRLAGDS
ncbi:MAG TPA: NDP-sugar synthase [Methylomirabilota bacterium]|jgi:NDP-sugar pyrophosphorylase family protein